VVWDDNAAAAVEQLRRWRWLGRSEVLHKRARAGTASRPARLKFRQHGAQLRIRVDVANGAEALDLLD
jgi:hypothetical protein